MPILRKLITLAVTTGLAKKAWDAYRDKPAASGTLRRESRTERPGAGTNWRRDPRPPGREHD